MTDSIGGGGSYARQLHWGQGADRHPTADVPFPLSNHPQTENLSPVSVHLLQWHSCVPSAVTESNWGHLISEETYPRLTVTPEHLGNCSPCLWGLAKK